jgi:hypothetical protein
LADKATKAPRLGIDLSIRYQELADISSNASEIQIIPSTHQPAFQFRVWELDVDNREKEAKE